MAEKIFTDPEFGEVHIRKDLRCRRLSLRVHPEKGVRISMPYYVSYQKGIEFFLSKREWVRAVSARQKELLRTEVSDMDEAQKKVYIEELRAKAKAVLPDRVSYFSGLYGLTPQKVTIKHNRTNWGSCSAKGNINLNLNLVRVPDLLRDYVILHELAHLKYHNHGEQFHALLENMCRDHLGRMVELGDETALAIAAAINRTRTPQSVRRVLEKSLKGYRLV